MSQLEAVSQEIDGHQYEMYMLPPLDSHDLFMDVVKMVGPTLGPVIDALFAGRERKGAGLDDLLEQEVGPDFFSKAATNLFGSIDKTVLKRVIEAFKEVTLVDKKPLSKIFDVHFKGELASMYKWLGWGMKVQWGKSLSALVSGIQNQGAGMLNKMGSPSPTTLSATG
jgi:hypothetical protein